MKHSTSRPRRWLRDGLMGAFVWTMAVSAAHALKPTERFTLEQLEREPAMSPKDFANLFEFFAFDFYPYVQDPADFLGAQAGDCDDYAVLADHILSRNGFHTRIIQIRLVGTNVDHAVCYVTEKKVYLDYNNRKYSLNLEKSKPFIRDIAEKVADFFERNWTSAFEFTYRYDEGKKHTQMVVVKTDDPKRDPDRNGLPSTPK